MEGSQGRTVPCAGILQAGVRRAASSIFKAILVGCLDLHHGALGSMASPARAPGTGRRELAGVMEIQVSLASRGFRVGPIDGVDGPRTQAAIRAFRQDAVPSLPPGSHQGGLPMGSNGPPALTRHVVTTKDLAALGPVPATWMGKSKAVRLSHETLLEAMAERSAAHPSLIVRLNPRISWNQVHPGTEVVLPRFEDPPVRPAARVSINLKTCTLLARDVSGRILLMAPCSVGRIASARPMGTLRVVSIAQNPSYTFDPTRFPESSEARSLDRKLLLPPGPNNPVGVAWIGLDRPGIGIHGTPSPETVGRPESHGCFRLANWDAAYLARIAWLGLPVEVGPGD